MIVVDSPYHRARAELQEPAARTGARAVSITGIGLISPLGNSPAQTWAALLDGRFIEDHARCALETSGSSRVTDLALHAARDAMESGRSDELSNPHTALIVGTSKGTVDEWLRVEGLNAPAVLSDVEGGSFGIAQIASAIARDLRIVGPRLTVSAACSSSLQALIRGVMMLRAGEVDRALIVAAESSLHPLFIGSFKRLGVLPPPGVGCRPFDRQRAGFLMSESAAAVLLEADDPQNDRVDSGSRVQIENLALAGDASHLTAADPDGLVLKHLIRTVAGAGPIELVHAHGTGTISNDPVELAAIQASLPVATAEPFPSLYSHKGALGHSLGAAGLVSVVINCMAHQTGIVPPNVRTADPLETRGLSLSPLAKRRPIHRSIAIAAGFGGACAAISLKSPAIF